jgi:hypothetical protein
MGTALISVISHPDLRAAEGHRVTVELTDGTLLDDCVVVSAGRLWARSVWLVKGDTDVFSTPEEIADITILEERGAA